MEAGKAWCALLYVSISITLVVSDSVDLEKEKLTATTNGTGSGRTNVEQYDCDQTFDSEACGYGKKIYSLSKYSAEAGTSTLDLCYSACNDSYSHVSLYKKGACETGCQLQVDAEKYRQQKLAEYEMSGDELIQQARLNQLWSHWMFEMLTGFDVFNDLYSTGDYEDTDDSQTYLSTYVVIAQSDDELSISTYRKIGGVVKTSGKQTTQTSVDTGRHVIPGSAESFQEDEDREEFYYLTCYTWYALCLLLISSSLTLIWLMCCAMTSKRQPRASKKIDEKKGLQVIVDFEVSDSKPAAIHKNADDVPMLKA